MNVKKIETAKLLIPVKKNVLVITGSAGRGSAIQKLIDHFAPLARDDFNFTILNDLKTLPHFNPALSIGNPPGIVVELRQKIEKSDEILICIREYVFSIPSRLKNAVEWCISTTVFSDMTVGLTRRPLLQTITREESHPIPSPK